MVSRNPTHMPIDYSHALNCCNKLLVLLLFAGVVATTSNSAVVQAQNQASAETKTTSSETDIRNGYLVEMPNRLNSENVSDLLGQLNRLAQSARGEDRLTLILHHTAGEPRELSASFEDALCLARAFSSPDLRRIRIVSWVDSEVAGHHVLPILASEVLVVSESAVIGDATRDEIGTDETIDVAYRTIAARRGLFPRQVVQALVNPSVELAKVSKVGGGNVFESGKSLDELRSSGNVASESVWSAPETPLRMTASQLRSARFAAGIVNSTDQAAQLLDLASVNPLLQNVTLDDPKGILLEVIGPINANRSRRWQSNLSASLEGDGVNTWVVAIDSPGGSLSQSATLASWFAQPELPLQTVAGFIQGEARGDAALIALATRPLYMRSDARIGGPGAQAINSKSVTQYDELIEQVSRLAKRPNALVRGLLDPSLEVYRFTNRKTGRVRFATEAELLQGIEDPVAEQERWQRGERIELADGLSSSEAIALGLAEDEGASVDDVSRRVGLSGTPPPLADRGIVRFVEKLGRSQSLAFFLLFIGFAALSTEANAPGLGVPGFVAMLCFALYFWIKFLSGTAEWLELLAFILGLAFIAIEVLVVPGFGIFGVGGLALTVLGIVLMSQTFVIPRNVYQIQVLTHSIWAALFGAIGLIAGFVAIRTIMPHVPLLGGLAMEAADNQMVSEAEKIADYGHLLGQQGVTTTPLRPSGKAKFGESIVQVISDGSAVANGDAVRVIEVHASKIIVEPLEN